MTSQQKILTAIGVLASELQIFHFEFSGASTLQKGTLKIFFKHKNSNLEKKLYYNQKNGGIRHNIKTHVSATTLLISSFTTIEEIVRAIKIDILKYRNGIWAENEVAKVLSKLVGLNMIRSFRKSEEAEDVFEGFDFLLVLNNSKSIKIDVTTNPRTKKIKKGIFLLLFSEKLRFTNRIKNLLDIIKKAS